MWKVLTRGILLKYGKSVKASTIVVNCDELPNEQSCSQPSAVSRTCIHWSGQSREYHSSYEDSGGGCHRGGPQCKWKQRMNSHQCDMWSSTHGCWHILEAVGWGTAVITGLQITDLCNRRRNRSEYEDNSGCWIRSIVSNVSTVGWTGFSELVHRYSQNTVSIVSRVIDSGLLTSKSILPLNVQHTKLVADAAQKNDTENKPCSSHFVKSVPSTQSNTTDVLHESVLELSSATISFLNQHRVAEAQTRTSTGDVSWQTLAQQCVDAVQCNIDALTHVKRGEMVAAINMWEQSCNGPVHSPSSLFNLALCYEQGLGVAQNLEKTKEMYGKAAELGHAKSAFNLAMLFLSDNDCSPKDFEKAMKLLQMAADLNLKEAQRELGVLYTEPLNRDMTKAVALFEQASAQKDARATYFLGICHEKGWGTDRNEALAASLYKSAGELGHIDALYNLAAFFEHGLGGLPLDLFEAIQYYQAAAAAGHKQAADRLVLLNSQHPRLNTIDAEDVKVVAKAKPGVVGDAKSTVTSADQAAFSPISHLLRFSISSDSDWSDDSSLSDSDQSASDSSTSCRDNYLWQTTPIKGSSDVFRLQFSTPRVEISALNAGSKRRNVASSPDEGNQSLENDSFDDVSGQNSPTDANTGRDICAFPGGAFGGIVIPHKASLG